MGRWAVVVRDGKPITDIYSNDICHLPISVGRSYYEGDVLKDVLHSVKKSFKYCIIHVADTLQAKNLTTTQPDKVQNKVVEILSKQNLLLDDISEEAKSIFYEQSSLILAKQYGNEWLNRNKDIINEILGNNYEIDTWDKWTNHPQYDLYRGKIEEQYNTNIDFKNAVDSAATNFLMVLNKERASEQVPTFDPVCVIENNKKYIKEETAIVKLWQDDSIKNLSAPQSSNFNKSKFIIVYPSNTPAHKCMIDCLNNLQVSSVVDIEQNPTPILEFFDIVFCCDKTENSSKTFSKMYQDISKLPKKMQKLFALQQPDHKEQPQLLPSSSQKFFRTEMSQSPKDLIKSTVTTFEQQILFFKPIIPPEETLEVCRQLIRFAQELQANTRMELKTKI